MTKAIQVRESQRASSAKVVLERVISVAKSDIIRHTCMHPLRRASSDYNRQRRYPLEKPCTVFHNASHLLQCVRVRKTSQPTSSLRRRVPRGYINAHRKAAPSPRQYVSCERVSCHTHSDSEEAAPPPHRRISHVLREDASRHINKSEEWHNVSDDDGAAKAEGFGLDGEEYMGGGGK